jgi:ABC-type branched-subunit amino acid transport system ATPase component
MDILKTKGIAKHFDGVHAVDGLSIGFEEGKITGLIGPNGSGKSTLINLLTGVMRMDGGIVVVGNSEEVKNLLPHEVADYGITRTFQNVRLFEQMLVLDNILVVLTKRNVFSSLFETHKKFHLGKAQEVLEKVGLWEKRNELAKNLSYGQRKLLEIGRVLAMQDGGGAESNIFFFDEPFAGLFPEMIKIVTSVIKELRDKGKTVILVEHNMDLIRELSDHIFVLDAGKLLAKGKPAEVLVRRDVVEAYLGE